MCIRDSPNGDGEIHPLSGLLFCKDCGAKMHIRIDYRNGGKRHVAYCSEYHKGKAKNPKCHSPHIIDADLLKMCIRDSLYSTFGGFYSVVKTDAFNLIILTVSMGVIYYVIVRQADGVFFFTESMVRAVSYTHLDVYKRQRHDPGQFS